MPIFNSIREIRWDSTKQLRSPCGWDEARRRLRHDGNPSRWHRSRKANTNSRSSPAVSSSIAELGRNEGGASD